jgi:hypothetical protein
MKAKLIKTPEQLYKLKFYNDEDMLACATALLSKQNCDEIFGIIDVEKLADVDFTNEIGEGPTTNTDINSMIRKSYLNGAEFGFNKAMELNKDKVFTEFDVNLAFVLGKNNDESRINKLINSKIQPTEIEVEIVTTTRMENGKSGIDTPTIKPKLDSEGCLILQRNL